MQYLLGSEKAGLASINNDEPMDPASGDFNFDEDGERYTSVHEEMT
jgi:hypothetical protein